MSNVIENELSEFNNQNSRVQDKIKAAIQNLTNEMRELGIEENKLNKYLEELKKIEELYSTRLTSWKHIIQQQKEFYLNNAGNPPEFMIAKQKEEKEKLMRLRETNKELYEKYKRRGEELAALKVDIEILKTFEKRYLEIKHLIISQE